MPKPPYTLAVCTYNRAASLERALDSIGEALSETSPDEWEVLVVDNNSSDRTPEVCREYLARLPLVYVFEGEQGLSNARNRAVSKCRGDLLVFTDDDVIVDRKWLAEYAKGEKSYGTASYFAGKILPSWETPRPGWLRDEKLALLSGLLVNYDLGGASRALTAGDPDPFGASFAIRRELFEAVGLFRADLGVKGTVPGRGEEAEYIERARRAGFQGAYLAEAVCRHPVSSIRLSIPYLYRYGIQKGVAEVRMKRQVSTPTILDELSYAMRGLFQLARGRGDRFRQCVINMGIQRGLRQEG